MSKRKYTRIGRVQKEVLELFAQGKTQREVAEHFGFTDKRVVKEFVRRQRRKEERMKAGILPRPKGRPRKDAVPIDINKEKDYEITRLKMENELLRNFLSAVGRG